MDISCLPKELMILIIGFLLREQRVRTILAFYAHARYFIDGIESERAMEDKAMARYIDDSQVQMEVIPYVEGEFNFSLPLRIIAAVGIDYKRGVRIVAGYEPESATFIFGVDENSRSFAILTADNKNAKIFSPESIIEDHHIIDPTDACSVLRLLSDRRYSDSRYQNIMIPAGSKPHALAFCVHSVAGAEIPIVCGIPENVINVTAQPSGRYTLYQIQDVSSISLVRGNLRP